MDAVHHGQVEDPVAGEITDGHRIISLIGVL